MGIPPERLPEMFELFAQGERSIARSEGGLGIGLTVVQRLTELHAAVQAADGKALGRVAHSVRGGSASLGAVGLAAVCRDVEEELRSGGDLDLAEAAGRIEAATVAARAGLAQLRVGSGG